MAEKVILVSTIGRISLVQLNRPHKKNAFSHQMYVDVTEALNKAATDPKIMMLVLTGVGSFFSSGTDLQPSDSMDGDMSAVIDIARKTLSDFVDAFINFPKLLVAIVNGPAIGIACTILGLCDIVYSSDKATFNTPFSVLGLTAEGCSSYTFPRIMGFSKAGEMLYLNRRLSALEAKECGLVADVYKDGELDSTVWPKLKRASIDLSETSIKYSKQLVRRWNKDILLTVNKAESERLAERWASEDVLQALMKFMSRKDKSKL